MSLSDVRVISNSATATEQYNTAEFLSWRRLHLSKSKLTNVAEMASFMAGFSVVATVELQINDQDVNPPLLAAFVITTSLLVGTCMIAIIIARCILPHLQSVAKTSKISSANLSPHDKMMRLIDISWVLTNSAALFFFTLDIILMCWIKFTFFSRAASIAATVIMGPVLVIILIFAIMFYRKIIKHQYVISNMKYEELEALHNQLKRAESMNSMSYQETITSNNNRRWASNHSPHHHHHHPQSHQLRHFSNHPGISPSHYHTHTDSRSMVHMSMPSSPTASKKSVSSSVFTV